MKAIITARKTATGVVLERPFQQQRRRRVPDLLDDDALVLPGMPLVQTALLAGSPRTQTSRARRPPPRSARCFVVAAIVISGSGGALELFGATIATGCASITPRAGRSGQRAMIRLTASLWARFE